MYEYTNFCIYITLLTTFSLSIVINSITKELYSDFNFNGDLKQCQINTTENQAVEHIITIQVKHLKMLKCFYCFFIYMVWIEMFLLFFFIYKVHKLTFYLYFVEISYFETNLEFQDTQSAFELKISNNFNRWTWNRDFFYCFF